MKKPILAIPLGFAILVSGAENIEEIAESQDQILQTKETKDNSLQEEKQWGWGWFITAGAGGSFYGGGLNLIGPSGFLSAGMMLKGISEKYEKYSGFISLDFQYSHFGKTVDTQIGYYPPRFASIDASVNSFDLTFNYNVSYALHRSDTYSFELLFGSGLGVGIWSETDKMSIDSTQFPAVSSTLTSFITNVNFGFRNVFKKHHALDLSIKTNMVRINKLYVNWFNDVGFYATYTFLKF